MRGRAEPANKQVEFGHELETRAAEGHERGLRAAESWSQLAARHPIVTVRQQEKTVRSENDND